MQIPEDYPNNALVTCVVATDPDLGENGRVTYSIESYSASSQPFRIQSDTGCIFVDSKEPLDYETRALFNLTIKVLPFEYP